MQLKFDVVNHILWYGIAIQFLCSVVSKLAQIIGLKLDAIDLFVASQTVDNGLSFLGI